MLRFSANLGFLWADLALPDAIRAAARAGFEAVECHYPYDEDPDAVRNALAATGLQMLGLNTRQGDVERREMGCAAVPHRAAEARAAIDEAMSYGAQIGARSVHVLAGKAQGAAARAHFCDALRYACKRAPAHMTVLIEPLNPWDVPGYFLGDTHLAAGIIEELALPNLKLMFDCYHVGRTEGDVAARLEELWPVIGHIQFAGVPDRGPPDKGRVDYRDLFEKIAAQGWTRPLGAEYRPPGATEDSLGWRSTLMVR